jgi:integrase
MAHIVKRRTADGSDRYDVRYRDPAGRVRNKTFRTKKDASRFASTTEADKLRGMWVDPAAGRRVFREYAEEWIDHRTTSRGRKLAPRTVDLYRHELGKHVYPTFGDLELGRITTPAVRAWYSKLIASGRPALAAKCYRLLRSILATAVADDLLVKNPCNIKGAGVERSPERTIATAEEVWKLADSIEPRYRALVVVGAFCGLRFSEAAGLQRKHINLLHRTLTVDQQLERVSRTTARRLGIESVRFGPPKSDAGYRTLALPEPLVDELEQHLDTYAGANADALVFTTELETPLDPSNFSAVFTDARKKAGVALTLRYHDLRHTHMTLAAQSGASTKELMRRLGQSTPAAALRYQHATDSRDVEIANAVAGALGTPSRIASS